MGLALLPSPRGTRFTSTTENHGRHPFLEAMHLEVETRLEPYQNFILPGEVLHAAGARG
jgi:cob(I)alamin adenosyltransferase